MGGYLRRVIFKSLGTKIICFYTLLGNISFNKVPCVHTVPVKALKKQLKTREYDGNVKPVTCP